LNVRSINISDFPLDFNPDSGIVEANMPRETKGIGELGMVMTHLRRGNADDAG
jgi:hypothetical protein